MEHKPSLKAKPGLSNDAVDGIAALLLIAMFLGGMYYWLNGMPS